MAWLPDGEKNFEDIFIRFDRMYERDRHTRRHRMMAKTVANIFQKNVLAKFHDFR